jgi:hypothetical protein
VFHSCTRAVRTHPLQAMAMMLQTLHKAGYNEQDILEGSADLLEVVKRYKDIPPSSTLPLVSSVSVTVAIYSYLSRGTEVRD